MLSAPIPSNEDIRLQALYESDLLDTPQEKEFDDIVQLASQLCDMPISLISLVDANRQWFKARVGLDALETHRDISFCSHAILQSDIFEIPDALTDLRFHDNPLVLEQPAIRFYAGVPLVTRSGNRLGTLCVIDRHPRELNDNQKFALQVLANNVVKIAELRIKNKHLNYLTDSQKRIITVLAHDVRNPLASIKSIIDYKNADYIDAEAATEMLNLAALQLDTTIEMVSNIVNWGQLQLKVGESQYETVDLKQLVDKVFDSELLNAKRKNNSLVNGVAQGTTIYTEKDALEFILRNLVSNSNKFTDDGEISIEINTLAGKYQITVKDNGVGMDQQKAEVLFGDANTLSTPGTRNEQGSGFGAYAG